MQTPRSHQMSHGFSIEWLIDRAKLMILDSSAGWSAVKADPHSLKDIYIRWILPLSALQPLCSIVAPGATPMIGPAIGFWIVHLALLPLLGFFAIKIAQFFGGSGTLIDGVKLGAYSATPSYLLSVLGLIPSDFIQVVGAILSLYGIYLLYLGSGIVASVPSSKRAFYTFATIVTFILVSMMLSVIVMSIMFTSQIPSTR